MQIRLIDIALLTAVAGAVVMSYTVGYISGTGAISGMVGYSGVPGDLEFWTVISGLLLSFSLASVGVEAWNRHQHGEGLPSLPSS